jgi:lysophospholipase L1-like esterase
MRLLTIWYGANDACLPHSHQHVPLDKFTENLSTLVQMVTSPTSSWYSPVTKIVLITPPPFNPSQWNAKHKSEKDDRTPENTAKYAQAVRDVGVKENVPVVDMFSAIMDATHEQEKELERYLSDGLHLTAEGYTVSSRQIRYRWSTILTHILACLQLVGWYDQEGIPRSSLR